MLLPPTVVINGILSLGFLLVLIAWLKSKKRLNLEIERKKEECRGLNSKLDRYSRLISVEDEVAKQVETVDKLKASAKELGEKYASAFSTFMQLEDEIKIYKTDLEYIEQGIYEPFFDFDTSERYKIELTKIINKQKNLIKEDNACVCHTNWHVENSREKGRRMVRRYIKLTLRAFNGECNTLISKVKWNNVQRYEERIKKSYEMINKLGDSNHVYITQEYLQLKLEELHLAYELAHKKQEEKEEQRRIRAEQREEERAQREFEKARRNAEKEEKQFQKALEKAEKELGLVSGDKLEKLQMEIEQLKFNLKEAHQAKERAISRAQETKSGHVYIVSNIGSFGEGYIK